MKLNCKRALLATAITALISQAAFAAPYAAGDLLVGFRDPGQPNNTYVLDLGAATTYRDATANIHNITNIGADLTSAFGSGWATDSTLFWGIVGNQNNSSSGSPVNGDPTRTLYGSQDQTVLGTQSNPASITLSGTRGTVANNITGFGSTFSSASANGAVNPNGIIFPTLGSTQNNDWAEFNDGTNSFGSTWGTGNNGVEGNSASGIPNTALDLYRILNSTSGASPTGTVGQGSYEGTFVIDAAGNISYFASADLSSPSVPEPVSTGVLAGLAFVGIVGLRRRQTTVAA